MANQEHLAILKKGVGEWNAWRKNNEYVQPDLSGANLKGVDLIRMNLSKVDLSGAYLGGAYLGAVDLRGALLSGADLLGAHCPYANLYKADLNRAHLSGVYFRSANLCEADLTEVSLPLANLEQANLSGAKLKNANFTECLIGSTIFSDVDLSEVKGLETCKHKSPSTIGIDTIYKSKGKIPEKFLRDAGVPEIFISYMDSLVNISPIQFYSCFISYCKEDTKFAERLFKDLQAKGLRVWFFPAHAKIGKSVWSEIDQAIRVYDKLIVICSKNSLKSAAVIEEMERALDKEARHLKETRKIKDILAPISLDDYLFDEWDHPIKPKVLRKVVGRFKGCKTNMDKYSEAFDKLMKALSAE